MVKLFHRVSKKAGLSPGTLMHVGEKRTEKVTITLMDYDEKQVREKDDAAMEDCATFKEKPSVTWFNVCGVHDVELIEEIGKIFNIHPLVLEDILNTGQRPKLEDHEDYLFVVLKMIVYDDARRLPIGEQISLIIGPTFVISFEEQEGDVFDTIRDRLRIGKGRIRRMGSDYLAYALIDAIVDHYFIILEKMGERIEELQEEVLSQPSPATLEGIQQIKQSTIFLRKNVWPLREAISALERAESKLITESVRIYLRDVYDHTIHVIDAVETYRDMTSGTLDVYLSSVSNKMNEVMKVLTIIATIFIPLTFIAGIYGMNFKHMPELEWKWGYLVVWAILIVLGVLMLLGFKRKKWL
jgi:magnesium transporter